MTFLETKKRDRCMIALAPTNNSLILHNSKDLAAQTRVLDSIPGGRVTLSEAENSINNAMEEATLIKNNRLPDNNNNRTRVILTIGLLMEKSTTHILGIQRMNSLMSFSGSSKRRLEGGWKRRETGIFTHSSRIADKGSSKIGHGASNRIRNTGRIGAQTCMQMIKRNSKESKKRMKTDIKSRGNNGSNRVLVAIHSMIQ
jgi:hypothetical protein